MSNMDDHWLPCADCDGTGVVYVAGPDYFGNYDSGDCSRCNGYGAVAPGPFVAVCIDGRAHGTQVGDSRLEAGLLAARLDAWPRDCGPHRAGRKS